MNEIYFLNYNFWDIFAVPESSALLENSDIDNDFCPFMFLNYFSSIFFLKIETRILQLVKSLLFSPAVFLYHTFCLAEGFLWNKSFAPAVCMWEAHWDNAVTPGGQPGSALHCSCAPHPNQPGFLPCCESLIELINWNHQDPTEIALNNRGQSKCNWVGIYFVVGCVESLL